jgi:hypothetical protein
VELFNWLRRQKEPAINRLKSVVKRMKLFSLSWLEKIKPFNFNWLRKRMKLFNFKKMKFFDFNWLRKRKDEQPAVDETEEEGLSTAVYLILNQQLFHLNGLFPPGNMEIVDREQAKVDTLMEWALALPEGPARNEYVQWLTYYYQNGINEARKELLTHERAKATEQYRRDSRRKDAAIAAITPTLPKPPRVI